MTKKKSTEAQAVGKVEGLSESTWKAQADQYKRENKKLQDKTKDLEKQVDWLKAELVKLRRTNQGLINQLHRR